MTSVTSKNRMNFSACARLQEGYIHITQRTANFIAALRHRGKMLLPQALCMTNVAKTQQNYLPIFIHKTLHRLLQPELV